MDRGVWEIAGAAYHGYVARRHKKKDGEVRSMLTDFLIGAHALRHGHRLITMNDRIYEAAFPELEIVYA